MHVRIVNEKGYYLAEMTFPKGQEYYGWEAIKDFCRAHQGIELIITISRPE